MKQAIKKLNQFNRLVLKFKKLLLKSKKVKI